MFTDNYRVVFENYSRHHHGARLDQKYGNRWSVTRKALQAQFARIDRLMTFGRSASCLICRTPDNKRWIVDHVFKIAGARNFENEHRLIAYVDREERVVRVLAFYPVVREPAVAAADVSLVAATVG